MGINQKHGGTTPNQTGKAILFKDNTVNQRARLKSTRGSKCRLFKQV